MTLYQGKRVKTPKGSGKVLYVRNAPPDYNTVASVSVILDSRMFDPRYTGSIFPVQEVSDE